MKVLVCFKFGVSHHSFGFGSGFLEMFLVINTLTSLPCFKRTLLSSRHPLCHVLKEHFSTKSLCFTSPQPPHNPTSFTFQKFCLKLDKSFTLQLPPFNCRFNFQDFMIFHSFEELIQG